MTIAWMSGCYLQVLFYPEGKDLSDCWIAILFIHNQFYEPLVGNYKTDCTSVMDQFRRI